jgi:hypothetical protein
MTRLVLASVLALAASGAAAQMSSMPAEVRAGIAGIGPVWGPEVLKQTVALYQPILKVAPRQGVRITTDLAYGAHEQQKADLAQPEASPPAIAMSTGCAAITCLHSSRSAACSRWPRRIGLRRRTHGRPAARTSPQR